MTINSVLIKNFGQIKGYYAKVSDMYTVLPGCDTSDYLLAIAGSLSYPVSPAEFYEKTGKQGYIQCNTNDIKETRALAENSVACVCKEYMACSIFQNTENEQFDKKLHMYLTPTEYYEDNIFSDITNGLGKTRVFRSYLQRFIKDFKPERIPSDNDLEVYIDRSGYFRCRGSHENEPVILTKDEELFFKLICFNTMHSFWEGAAKLRSVDVPQIPLLVGNLPWNYGECRLRFSALKHVLEAGSQVVILAS